MPTRKIISALLLATTLILSTVIFVFAQEPPPVPPNGSELTPSPIQIDGNLRLKIEPPLLKKLLEANGKAVPFIAYLKEQTNLEAVVTPASADPVDRRQAIVDTLQQTARQSQTGVLQLLTGPGISGQNIAATQVKSLWIVNAVAARGTLDTILALAARPDVQIVRLDKTISIGDFSSSVLEQQNIQDLPLPKWGISKIRANLVHTALGIDGTGVVIANMDTGVDWLHPDLQTQYRGYTGPAKLPTHAGNWFDATGEGAIYPVDGNGHGTHTMGSSVGKNGIGVAPGARWIAARAFDSNGNAQNSWIHNAFQWILAPNGDAALAPDIVNNSWSSDNGFSTEFESDVQTLLSAGIYPVFAAGNNGPNVGTVGSPASFDITFSVGATDINDDIASFSGRGPSPWGKIKPEVSAPGKDVNSTLPGGAYGNHSGTSMAAPHVAGVAALLLQASPTLSNNLHSISHVITSTAVPMGSPIPNNNYGWGRIDAYNAVMSVALAGTIKGVITDAVTGAPVTDANIRFLPRLNDPAINTTSDISGTYIQGLAPGTYDVTASAFDYEAATVSLVDVSTGTTTFQNFSLSPKPSGFLKGTITNKNTGQPLTATLTVQGTPVSTLTTTGNYQVKLPTGLYTVTVMAAEQKISNAVNITINPNVTTVQDFRLDSGPSILLVDSGKWYQESQLDYYRQALEDALYTFDTWSITQTNYFPTETVLSRYDIVIWSAPSDSPGYIGADKELEAYLAGGGNLLLSGQDVAYFDGGSYIFGTATYLENYLKATYVQDNADSNGVTGLSNELFTGLSLTISGGDGADNQILPDVIAVDNPEFATPVLYYNDSQNLAGLHVGQCLPYNAIFMSFGLEGINSRSHRSEVMKRSVNWLLQPPAQAGVELSPTQETVIGNFGSVASHTFKLRNTGAAADTILMELTTVGPYNWATESVPSPVSLLPCTSQYFTVTVQISPTRVWHITDTFTVTAQSGTNPAFTDTMTRNTKTPAPVLLVDDDRWYSFADRYKEALHANNINYDYWYVPKSWSGEAPPSPPLETLEMYPITVWYTAYDWFQPLTLDEETRLMQYLDKGGRLFLGSQEFLYRHKENHNDSYGPFAQTYLGVQQHTEDYTSTLTIGDNDSPAGAFLGPYPFTFPPGYRNHTDALTPTVSATIMTRGHEGQPNGLTHTGTGPTGKTWHTNFLAYGPELITLNNHVKLLQRSLGWLSWLGSSTVKAGTTSVDNGATITYTVSITNNGWDAISTAWFTATFPGYLTPGSASPPINFNGNMFTWNGPLAVNQSKTFTYTAQINKALPAGTIISQTNWLAYPEHNILFNRIPSVNVAPNLTESSMSVLPDHDVENNDILTYTIVLKNNGTVDSFAVTTTNALPNTLNLIAVNPPNGMVATGNNSFTWTTSLAKNKALTLTFQARISASNRHPIHNLAYVEDGINERLSLSVRADFLQIPVYLPLILKNP